MIRVLSARRDRVVFIGGLLTAVLLAFMLTCSAARAASWPPAGFTEGPADQNTSFPDTEATDVSVYAPLPSSFPAHPAACDYLHFLRIKHIGGPQNPSDASKILIAQPGILEGASPFYEIGADMVTRAYNERHSYIEFWAVDRRPNCLEDLNGILLERQTHNLHDLID